MTAPLESHPIAEHFPEMSAPDMSALVADIRANGLREPIMLFEGKILDGRHRYKACIAAHVDVRIERFEGTYNAAFIYAYSLNLQRRHLNGKDKRELITKELARDASRSDRVIAKTVGAHGETVAAVRQELGAEIRHHEKRVGRDGVAQSATKRPGMREGTLPREERVQQIRVLVDAGHNAEQIAEICDIDVRYARTLMRDEGLKISIPKRGRSINASRIIAATVSTISGTVQGIEMLRSTGICLDKEEAASLLSELLPALKSIHWMERCLREIANG